MGPQSRRRITFALGLWDTAWKIAAVAAALRYRQYKWILPLATISSLGILPMVFLWRYAKPQAPAQDAE